jgi:hypothetical protein
MPIASISILDGAVSPAVSWFDLQPPKLRLRIARLSRRFLYAGVASGLARYEFSPSQQQGVAPGFLPCHSTPPPTRIWTVCRALPMGLKIPSIHIILGVYSDSIRTSE